MKCLGRIVQNSVSFCQRSLFFFFIFGYMSSKHCIYYFLLYSIAACRMHPLLLKKQKLWIMSSRLQRCRKIYLGRWRSHPAPMKQKKLINPKKQLLYLRKLLTTPFFKLHRLIQHMGWYHRCSEISLDPLRPLTVRHKTPIAYQTSWYVFSFIYH